MLTAILTWWLQQLRSLLPERWCAGGERLPDGLVIDCGALGGALATANLFQRRRRGETLISRLDLHPAEGGVGAPTAPPGLRRILRLTGVPLQRELFFPVSVEADLANVLSYDIGRLAPFTALDIFWNWRIVHRDGARKRLTVQLWYVPRKTLQPLLAILDRIHLTPSELEVVEPAGQVRRIALQEPSRTRNLGRWMAVGAAVVVLAILAAPFVMQSRTLAKLDQQVVALRPLAARVDIMRQRFATQEPGPAAHAVEARRVGDALQVLAQVTNALPDDTVVTDITVHEHRVTITGSSQEAALLIATLTSTAFIRDPIFTAPVVRDPATLRDSFSIRADLPP